MATIVLWLTEMTIVAHSMLRPVGHLCLANKVLLKHGHEWFMTTAELAGCGEDDGKAVRRLLDLTEESQGTQRLSAR